MLISYYQAFWNYSHETITRCYLFFVSSLRKTAASRVIKDNSLSSWIFLPSIFSLCCCGVSLLLFYLLSLLLFSPLFFVSLLTLSSCSAPSLFLYCLFLCLFIFLNIASYRINKVCSLNN